MSRKILIVEDNIHNMRLLEQIMEDFDETFALVKASSGEMALALSGDQQFDLVLMDLSLPDMDGIETTKRLKALGQFARTPFIVVTAHAMMGDEMALREVFDDYISKPIDAEKFMLKITQWIGERT
jgi:CheY-like chemotaxis protein